MTEECRSCHAGIDWAMSVDGTKKQPVDHDSADAPDGKLIVWRDGTGILRFRYRHKNEDTGPGEHTGTSHFATCPNRDLWRKHKRPGQA